MKKLDAQCLAQHVPPLLEYLEYPRAFEVRTGPPGGLSGHTEITVRLPEWGDQVHVPADTRFVGVITSDPNEAGRVRIDWTDGKSKHFGFFPLIQLTPI